MNLIPAQDKAIVEPLHLRNSAIILPDRLQISELIVAKIVKGSNLPSEMRVLIPARAGLPIRDNDTVYRLINSDDILCYLESEDDY